MKKVMLIVLDGWGYRKARVGNAIAQANPAYFNFLWKMYLHTTLKAAGEAVGLRRGMMGNSEVGHLNIGAGRVVKQTLLRIDESIKDGSFFRNKALLAAAKKAKRQNGTLHILGLLSDAGVHSHIDHLFALLKFAKKENVAKVRIHIIADGRDTEPRAVMRYMKALQKEIKRLKLEENAEIVTLMGRFYAMDRDKRWNRTKKAYDTLILGKGRKAKTIQDAVRIAYKKGESDEFIMPTTIGSFNGIKENEVVVFFNFREDRARQVAAALAQKNFGGFHGRRLMNPKNFLCMHEYGEKFNLPALFKKEKIKNTLGEMISRKKLKQLRIAETEKYAHVTYFFNGGTERAFPGEERIIVPSPKVKTYDKKPEMNAYKITKIVLQKKKTENYVFILANFANADMVGHTGKFAATKKAIRTVDTCLRKIHEKAKELGYVLIITGDHGNAEQMNGNWQKSHTVNDVPFVLGELKKGKLKNRKLWNKILKNGDLGDIGKLIMKMIHE